LLISDLILLIQFTVQMFVG